MQFVACVCVLFVATVLVSSADARKTFSTGRSGGNSRRSGSTVIKHKHIPPPVKPHKMDTVNTNFLNSERAGSFNSVNTHFRGDPFKKIPEAPKHNAPKNNGQIGFENLGNQGNHKLGFDKVNSEVQRKPSNSYVPSAPPYPVNNPPYPVGASYPVKPIPSAPVLPGHVPANPAGNSYPAKPVANAPPYPSAVLPQPGNVSYPVKPIPSAPIYPGSAPSYPANPVANAPPYPSAALPQPGDVSHPVKPIPSAPIYPGSAPSYPGDSAKPIASAPYGPPPVYPGYGTNTHSSGFEAPPPYPGRPVNAPPVYLGNVDYGQRNPMQPSVFSYPNQRDNNPYQQVPFIGQSNLGQPNTLVYPNTANNFNSYPSQGNTFQSGNSYGNPHVGGYGQSYSGYNGYPYGGSQPNPYGGSPFSSSFGSNPFPGSYNSNPYYSPNNFGFSNNPGYFGSSPSQQAYPGNYNNYGYHKKSRFGGLPIPIPIPIPIPLGSFGGFGGGHSYNHDLLDTFIKSKNISSAENTTTSVFILNNSTVTPCTTDQFIYDSLNVTVVSCTANNCTAVKLFTTTNVSGESSVHAAVITMCLEPNATYSSHAENVKPRVSEVHSYWMRLCKDTGNNAGNLTDQGTSNATVNVLSVSSVEANTSIDHSLLFATANSVEYNTTATPSTQNATVDQTPSLMNSSSSNEYNIIPIALSSPIGSTLNTTGVDLTSANSTGTQSTKDSTLDQTLSLMNSSSSNEYNITPIALSSPSGSSLNSTGVNSTSANSTGTYNSSSMCEIFHCSWIEMCLPPIEIIHKCVDSECNKTKTAYEPCVRIKMCKSPGTPISTFATLNTTISRTDQFKNVSSFNDVANLTLISYIYPTLPESNHSKNVTDSNGLTPPLSLNQDVRAPANATEVAVGEVTSKTSNGTLWASHVSSGSANSAIYYVTTTLTSSAIPTGFPPNYLLICLGFLWAVTNDLSHCWK